MKIKYHLLILLFILLAASAYSQEQKERNFTITPTIGLSWRTTVMNFFNFGRVERNSKISYHYEKNIQGASLNPGVQVRIVPANVILEYTPNLRYDHMYEVWSDSCHLGGLDFLSPSLCYYPILDEIKEFTIDHNFNVFLRISKKKGKKAMVGVGASIINSGKGFIDPTYGGYYNLQFSSYNLLAVIPIKKSSFLNPRLCISVRAFLTIPTRILCVIVLGYIISLIFISYKSKPQF